MWIYFSQSQQLLVEYSDFAIVVDVEYELLPPFCSHYKKIGYMLFGCKRCPQSDMSDMILKPKQRYVSKSTLHTIEKDMNIHNEVVNSVNI